MLLLLAACGQRPAPLVDADSCHRLQLKDQAGRAVIGAEDLAVAGDWLFVSAYDRPAAERAAARADGPQPPAGGLYALPVAALGGGAAAGGGAVRVADLLAPALGRATRPHGIDARLAPGGTLRLAAVLRDYRRVAGRWRLEARAVVLADGPGGWGVGQVTVPLSPDANDVALLPAGLAVSYDGGRGWRSILGQARGRVAPALPGAAPIADGLALANGLAVDRAGALWVAETRAERIVQPGSGRAVALPGGPDNLGALPDGRILAAVHPSLWRYGLHRYGWPGGAAAPSRVVVADPASGRVRLLYEDARGRRFAGATAAALAGRWLVLGAVREAGLLLCPLPERG